MTETLEWFQCKACGRRHRWQADIAGTEIQCTCGDLVTCPTVEVDTSAPIDTGERRAIRERAEREVTELAPVAASAPRTVHGRGMSPFTRALLWSLGAAIGFVLLIHAVFVQIWPYIIATVLWTPFSFWKFIQARKRWQGNRSLKRAFLEQVGEFDNDPDDDDDEDLDERAAGV